MSTLYIIATPIGNLEDVTLRALRILKEVDVILCEDTRTTQKLLARYEIKTPTLSYHQHSRLQKTDYIVSLLKEGKNLALVTDAGTPGISDPGGKLVEIVVRESVSDGGENISVIPVPGPCAAVAALSVSGFPADEFLFLGFPPHKKGRQTFFKNLAEEAKKRTVVFYESPHRIIKTLEQLDESLKAKSYQLKADIVVCRELTKKFETIYRGTPQEATEKLKSDKILGEFVVVIRKSQLGNSVSK